MTTLSIDQAEAKIRAYWASPVGNELQEAAAFARIRADILHGVSWTVWRTLYDRLRTGPEAKGIDSKSGEKPILVLLWEVIDRRPRLGIDSPTPTPGQRWREKAG